MLRVRQIMEKDAEEFLLMQHQLDGETSYMLLEPNERRTTSDEVKKRIRHIHSVQDFLLVAVDKEEQIAGYIQAVRETPKKTRHTAYIVIGLLQKARGKGIGTLFFQELNQWAVEQEIKRLELTVMVENQAAVNLYKKAGFEIEGTKRKSIFQNNNYMDEYYMSKIFE